MYQIVYPINFQEQIPVSLYFSVARQEIRNVKFFEEITSSITRCPFCL